MPKGRPKGSENIHPTVQLAIIDLTYRDNSQLDDEKILAKLTVKLGDRFPMPALGTIGNWRRRLRKEPADIDKPWSLGASVQHAIPIEANKDVVDVWKRCVVRGYAFSIRQAWWVARLRGIVPVGVHESRTYELYAWASLYAGRERASDQIGIALDTADLDARIVFQGRDYWALVQTRVVSEVTLTTRIQTMHQAAPELALHEVDILEQQRMFDNAEYDARNEHEAKLRLAVESVPGDDAFRAVASNVIHIWTTAFQRNSSLKAMDEKTRYDALYTLMLQVAAHFQRVDAGEIFRPFRPSDELLEQVGYDPDA